MGRTGGLLVAAAVAALAVVAAVDAVLGGSSPPPAPRPPPPATDAAETVPEGDPFLEAERVVGRLLFIDEGCRMRSVVLPEVEPRDVPGLRACSFTSSPGGVPGADGAVVNPEWPREPFAAACDDGRVHLHTLAGGQGYDAPRLGPVTARWPGCAPAWRPGGALTLVRGGEVVDLGDPQAGGRARVVLSRADVERAFTGSPWQFVRPSVEEVAWLDEDLLAAVVRNAEGGDVLALFRDRRLAASTPSPYDVLGRLRVSPRGTYVAAQIGDAPALVLLDRDGEFVPTGLRGHSITWSPDELWAAVAAPEGVYVFAAGGRATRFARIELAARDLFWR